MHYHPRDPDGNGPLSERDFEYVEIYNRTSQSLDLTGWRVAGASEDEQFVFPAGTVLAARQALVVVGFEPTSNPTLRGAFNLTFSVGGDVPVLGPLAAHAARRRTVPSVWRSPPLLRSGKTNRLGCWSIVSTIETKLLGRTTCRPPGIRCSEWPTWPSAIRRPVGPADVPGPAGSTLAVGLPGDVTQDGQVDVADVDLLCVSLRAGDVASILDVNRDGQVNRQDFEALISDVLHTHAGDANLDRVFNSADLVSVFIAAEYEDDIIGNSTWVEGDWDCDGEFTTGDLVAALIAGGYSAASRSMNAAFDAGGADALKAAALADHEFARSPSGHDFAFTDDGAATASLLPANPRFDSPPRGRLAEPPAIDWFWARTLTTRSAAVRSSKLKSSRAVDQCL